MGGSSRRSGSKSHLQSFNLMDLDSKLCSKKELNRWIRRHRKSIKLTLGGLLVMLLMGLYNMLRTMARAGSDLPDDLRDFTAQEWQASGLNVPKKLAQQQALQGQQRGTYRAEQI